MIISGKNHKENDLTPDHLCDDIPLTAHLPVLTLGRKFMDKFDESQFLPTSHLLIGGVCI